MFLKRIQLQAASNRAVEAGPVTVSSRAEAVDGEVLLLSHRRAGSVPAVRKADTEVRYLQSTVLHAYLNILRPINI